MIIDYSVRNLVVLSRLKSNERTYSKNVWNDRIRGNWSDSMVQAFVVREGRGELLFSDSSSEERRSRSSVKIVLLKNRFQGENLPPAKKLSKVILLLQINFSIISIETLLISNVTGRPSLSHSKCRKKKHQNYSSCTSYLVSLSKTVH